MGIVHILSHTHWDREWYINSKYVNEWLPTFFERLFAMMEKERRYCFVLDGQMSIVDDCLAEMERRGLDTEGFLKQVRRYAKEGRLILGPYYLQPDWQLVSPEALVRNLLIGREMARELGGGMNTGWLLDNFGQISQAPQLHAQFGIKGIVVWRGVELDPFRMNSEFVWEGADGTRMMCGYLLSSYRNAMHLADHPEMIKTRIQSEVEKIAPFATTENILLMNGYDQEMEPDDILPHIRDGKADFDGFQVCQSTPDRYMDALLAGGGERQTLHGALYSGRYISVFPGALSSRMYLKLSNDRAQRALEQDVEPLCTVAWLYGRAYPAEEIRNLWKLLLKNHPHDSICGVSVDDVHSDMEERFLQVQTKADRLLNDAAGWLAERIDTSMHKGAERVYAVMNTAFFEGESLLFLPVREKYLVLDEHGRECPAQRCEDGMLCRVALSGMEMTSVGLYPAQEAWEEAPCGKDIRMENEFYIVRCERNGTLTVLDKRTKRTYERIGMLEDTADAGDEYNHSPLAGEKPLTTEEQEAFAECIEDGPLRKVLHIRYVLRLPEALNEGRTARSNVFRSLPVETWVTLAQGDPVISFTTSLRNTCKDHRLRALFPTDIRSESSYAQTQFDVTRHEIKPPAFDNDHIPKNVARVIIGARENVPITQFPQRDFAAVSDGRTTAAVLNRGLPEYEVLPEHTTIALTLFRAQEWLARSDLRTRVGDAGPQILVPDAQCLREMTFHYGFCVTDLQPSELIRTAEAFGHEPIAVQTTAHNGIHYVSPFAFASLKPSIGFSALKLSEDGTAAVLRMYHAGSEKERLLFKNPLGFDEMLRARLDEDGRPIPSGGLCEIDIAPKEIVTLLLKGREQKRERAQETPRGQKTFREPERAAAFDAFPSVPLIDGAMVLRERRRAERLKADYEKCLEERARMKKEWPERLTDEQKARLAHMDMQVEALRRSMLEAELSAVYAEKERIAFEHGKQSEIYSKHMAKTDPLLRKLAYQLNLARISKRLSEYLGDYFDNRLS